MDWNQISQNVMNFLFELATSVGLKLLYAILVIIVGSRIVRFLVKRIINSKLFKKIDDSVAHFLTNCINFLLRVTIFIAAAMIIGVPASSFVAILTSAGVAIGLALQGSLSNFAGGIMILIFKPFKTGDYIECGDAAGTVEDITIFYTTLVTPDNKVIHLPNGTLSNSEVINYSEKSTRRLSITVSCAYGSDQEKVKALMLEMARSHELVLTDPAPFVALDNCADSSLDFIVRVWCKTSDYWTVYYDLTAQSATILEANGIEIPYPQMDVHIKN